MAHAGQALDVLAVELATDDSLAALEGETPADLIVTPERAATLGLLNRREAWGAPVVVVARAPWLDRRAMVAAADPACDLETPLKGPFPVAGGCTSPRAAEAAIALAKRARLLPAMLAVAARGPAPPDRLVVPADAALAWRRATRLAIVTRARLPLAGAEDTQVTAFRADDGGPEHLALTIGRQRPPADPATDPACDAPLVRIHSACLTGDLLGSLKCDCGEQLRGAVALLAGEGGILLYLQQEGRGIGLANKLRAYALQDQGFDTVDANLRLGFLEDERDFDLAAAMLRLLAVPRVRLLSNNPAKARGLEEAGIAVAAMVPHGFGPNPHNVRYLATKRDRQGHRLPADPP